MVSRIQDRVALMTRLPVLHQEDMQVLRIWMIKSATMTEFDAVDVYKLMFIFRFSVTGRTSTTTSTRIASRETRPDREWQRY